MAMEELILARANLLHGISNAIVVDIKRKYKLEIADERIAVSPLGLEDWADQASATVNRNAAESVALLFVGRLESRKGIDVLLKIAPALLKRFPNAVLDIVGDDTIPRPDGTTYKGEFLNSGVPQDILSRIVFHGRVEEDALRAFYRNCDVFVATKESVMRFPIMSDLSRLAQFAIIGCLSATAGAASNYTIGPPIGLAGADFSEGLGINASGQVTGYSSITGVKHAFRYTAAGTSDLGTLGGSASVDRKSVV